MVDVLKLSADTFDTEVLKESQPVLVDFTATWCGPCKMLEPVVKQLAGEWDGRAKVLKLDVDENPDLAMTYTVMSVPTLILFKGGRPVERLSGYRPKDQLIKKFGPLLG